MSNSKDYNEENMTEAEEQMTSPEGDFEQPMSPTRDYFTENVNSQIREMTEEEMINQLLSLESTRYWIAILKYLNSRMSNAQNAVVSGDPLKDPTSMLRNQGIMLGLCDLQNAVIMIKQQREEEAEAENKKNSGEQQ